MFYFRTLKNQTNNLLTLEPLTMQCVGLAKSHFCLKNDHAINEQLFY